MVLIKFDYRQEINNYECNTDDNFLLICKNYILNKKLNPKIVFFSYNGNRFFLKDINPRMSIGEEMNRTSQKDNEMKILVYILEKEMRTPSMFSINQENNTIPPNILINNLNNENEEYEENKENEENEDSKENEEKNENKKNNEMNEDSEKILVLNEKNILEVPLIKDKFENKNNNFLFRVYIFLILEYLLIDLIVSLGFIFGFCNLFRQKTNFCLIAFVLCSIIILFLSHSYDFIPKKNILFSLYLILFIPTIILFCFLLSNFIPNEIILCSLYLLFLDILSIGIYTFISKAYNKFWIIFLELMVNVITIPIFYFTWIKDVYYIIYISDISIIFMIYFLIISYIIFKLLNNDSGNSVYAVIISNFSIFNIFSINIYKLYCYSKSTFKDNIFSGFKTIWCKAYLVLMIEFFFILFTVWLGFFLEFNEIFIKDKSSLLATIIPTSIILFILICGAVEPIYSKLKIILHIMLFLQIVCVILFIFFLSKYIPKNIILSVLLLLLLVIITITCFLFLNKSFNNKYGFYLFPFIVNVIAITHIRLFWIENTTHILYISIFGLFFILSFSIVFWLNFDNKIDDDYFCIAMNCNFIFSYFIYLGWCFIGWIFDEFYKRNDEQSLFFHKIIKFLLLENVLIMIVLFISFFTYFEEYSKVRQDFEISIIMMIVGIPSFHSYYIIFNKDKTEDHKIFLWLDNLIYIPLIIYLCHFISASMNNKSYIICIFVLVFIYLLFMEIYILCAKELKIFLLISIPLTPNIILLFIFKALWIKENSVIYVFLIATAYFICVLGWLYYFDHCCNKKVIFIISSINYTLLFLPAIYDGILYGEMYLIYKCFTCCCY